MPTVLLCTDLDLESELQNTVLWRNEVERYVVSRSDEARMLALAAEPDVIVVDRDMPGADDLVASLREGRLTRPVSIVILTREPIENEAWPPDQAAAILSLPVGPGWDDPLFELMKMPPRARARYAVRFDVETWHQMSATAAAAVGVNLSISGMLMESRWRFNLGDNLDLRMLIPGIDGAIVSRGTLIRQSAPLQFGMRFDEIAADGACRLENFLARQPL